MKAKRSIHWYSIAIGFGLVLMVIGCAPGQKKPVGNIPSMNVMLVTNSSNISTMTLTPSPIPTRSLSPTVTKTQIPTASSTQIPTATPTPQTIVIQCAAPVVADLNNLDMDGILVVDENADQDLHSNQYFLNLRTHQRYPLNEISNHWLRNFEVSPDSRYIAYLDGNRYDENDVYYVVRESGGKIIARQLAEKNWYGIVGWQDNQHILINLEKRRDGYIDLPLTMVRWNPFNGNKEELLPDFPGIDYIIDGVPNWGGYVFAPTVYDPTMQFVVYPWVQDGKSMISLWSLKSKKVIVEIENTYGSYGNQPTWSLDGKTFLINLAKEENKEELYQLSVDGQMKRLTKLSQQFSEIGFGGYSWSPNGQQVAFWARTVPDTWREAGDELRSRTPMRLAVLDLNTSEIRSFCLPGEGWGKSIQGTYYTGSNLLWSPNGRQIAVEKGTPGQGAYLIIIDLESNKAWRFAANSAALGWLTDRP